MKFTSSSLCIFTLSCLLLITLSNCEEKNLKKQVNYVKDPTNFGSELGVVIRKNPSVYVDNRLDAPLLEPPKQFLEFGNSNTSSLPNIGGYPKSPEVVNPTILFHSKSPVSVVKTTPAHLGYRNEKTTLTSFNKETGKTESHDIVNTVPIYGNINSVHTVLKSTLKPYDLQYRRFKKERSQVAENPEMAFTRDERYVRE